MTTHCCEQALRLAQLESNLASLREFDFTFKESLIQIAERAVATAKNTNNRIDCLENEFLVLEDRIKERDSQMDSQTVVQATSQTTDQLEQVWLRRKDAARVSGLSESWLKRAAWEKNGPPCAIVGRQPLYNRDELLAWIAAQRKV